MLELTADKIKDFQTCSLLYKYKHVDEIYTPIIGRDLLKIQLENVMKRVLNLYFYQKQDDNAPSQKSLMNRFQKLWFAPDTSAEKIINSSTFSHDPNRIHLAADTLQYFSKFYEDFDKLNFTPLLIREDFSVPITKNTKLSGIFDLVLKNGNNYSVIKWRVNKKPAQNTFVDFTVLDHAFRHRMDGRDYSVQYYIYNFDSKDKGFQLVDIKPEDYYTILYWAQAIEEEKIYPSRRGLTTHCKVCFFDKPCKERNLKEAMVEIGN